MQHIKLELAHVMPLRGLAGRADDTTQPAQQPRPLPALASACGEWHWRGPLLPLLALLTTTLATGFHRFLARFSGRRRTWPRLSLHSGPPWALLVLVATSFVHFAEACSSRTTPKPRPPAPTARPNITFHTYVCPTDYDTWYCLNGATCFTVKIGPSVLYNCECADGYMGPRCEYKDLDGTYLPSQRRYMLETASIAGGATIAVFLVVILCIVVYVHYKRKAKQSRSSSTDCVDGPMAPAQRQPTFGTRLHKQHHFQQQPCGGGDPELQFAPCDRGDARVLTSKEHLHVHQVTLLNGASGEHIA